MNKWSLTVATLMLSLMGTTLVHADSSDDGSSEKRLKKKHEALEGQEKAQRVQHQQMSELKDIQKKRQLAEKADAQAATQAPPQAEAATTSAPSLWRRGSKVPDDLAQDESQWVDDWQKLQLPEPGDNQRWIQFKSGYVLMDTQSNVIEDIALGQ
jgi:Ni/Co efflux regulator RcnB